MVPPSLRGAGTTRAAPAGFDGARLTGSDIDLMIPHQANVRIIEAIDPSKDVDGFHPVNVGRMMLRQPGLLP